MARLIDASLWVDLMRARSPRDLKLFIAPYIFDAEACLAEPVIFEVLRYATEHEARQIEEQFETIPVLPTPASIWADAAELGQACRRAGLTPGSLDLLIAAVALHHDAELTTFDGDFEGIAAVSELRVTRLRRPS